ncbi:MAG: hypothetical protein WBQ32_11135 [Ignavibacteriaceae bacterium]
MSKKLNIFLASIIFSIVLWGSISLSEFYYTNIDVKLSLVNLPNGYSTGSTLPDKVKLRVKGQGWRLVSLNVGPEAEYFVSVNNDSGSQVISLYDFLESNRWLLSDVDIISIQPDSLRFYVERIISKKLSIKLDLDLEFKPGYDLASDILLNPDSVMAFGPVSFLKTMKEIRTKIKPLGPLDSKTETEVGLPIINGFTFDANQIEVTIDVQKIVDKQFDNIPVEVLNIPQGKEVVLLPNKIALNIRGGIEILGKLDEKQFRAYVYYNELVQDTTGSVTPKFEMLINVTLQYFKPERLRYIIRSF